MLFNLQEIESLKEKTESLQSELLKREDEWLKEKQDLIVQKEDERRKAVAVIQDQNEAEYKQFIAEHKDTLDHALKAAREQHTKEKVEIISDLILMGKRESWLLCLVCLPGVS